MTGLLLFLALPLLAGQDAGQSPDYLSLDASRAQSIALSMRANGRVGSALDFRVIHTEHSYNYKLRATWLTPEVIRATARLAQITRRLSAGQAEALVREAEAAGETVVLVEIDPREGSGVIPNDWAAALGARGTQRSSKGTINPDLRTLPALAGGARRDYAYDVFWVVFPLRAEDGAPLFDDGDSEAELSVRIYDKTGTVRWRVPESIRQKLRNLAR